MNCALPSVRYTSTKKSDHDLWLFCTTVGHKQHVEEGSLTYACKQQATNRTAVCRATLNRTIVEGHPQHV
jgi:hypothetical protein